MISVELKANFDNYNGKFETKYHLHYYLCRPNAVVGMGKQTGRVLYLVPAYTMPLSM